MIEIIPAVSPAVISYVSAGDVSASDALLIAIIVPLSTGVVNLAVTSF